MLGPIFFKHVFSGLLIVVQNVDFASYADDNTIYDAGDSIDEVIFSLQDLQNIFLNGSLIIK